MTEKLTPRTLDLEFQDSSFARRVVSLDKELLHFVSLHPGVEIGTGDILLVTLQWTSIQSRGEQQYS